MSEKSERLIVALVIVAVACLITMFVAVSESNKQRDENAYLKTSWSKFTVANGGNVGKGRALRHEYQWVSAETGVPEALINAVQIHENMGTGFEFAVKKLYPGITDHKPCEWQARAAAHIFTYEAFEMILKDPKLRAEYFKILGARYCGTHRGDWAASVKAIYENEIESEVIGDYVKDTVPMKMK